MASKFKGPGGQFHFDLDLKFLCLNGLSVPIGSNGVGIERSLKEVVESLISSLLLKKQI